MIFGAGAGMPYFSTDTVSAQRALECQCDMVLMCKSGVDGVYDSDPRTNPDARKLDTVTYADALRKGLEVVDAAAFSLCMENGLPMVVFGMEGEGNITRALLGERMGTLVTPLSRPRPRRPRLPLTHWTRPPRRPHGIPKETCPMIDETMLEAEEKMEKAVEVAKEDLSGIRTGRAHPGMFNKVLVDYYGAPTPLQQLASFQTPEARTILITPFDKGAMPAIEKALRTPTSV